MSLLPCPVSQGSRFRVATFPALILLVSLLVSCGSAPPSGREFLTSDGQQGGTVASARGNAFVSPKARDKVYQKVAVMPFRAPVDLVGASIADMVATEILKTYKYELIERSQIEQILQEQSLGMKGVTESALAMQVGKILGVQGVIVGTVPEYGMRAVESRELPAVGINIRMIDAETGSIIWTVSDSAIATKVISLSSFTGHLIESMIAQLRNEWVRTGDLHAVNLPSPQIISAQGFLRKAVIEVFADSSGGTKAYIFRRSSTKEGPFRDIGTLPNRSGGRIVFEDTGLLDAETYYYQVAAEHVSGLAGRPAGPVTVTTVGAPEPILDIRAEDGGIREVPLRWTPSSDPNVAGYVLFRATTRNGPWQKIAHVKKSSAREYVDKGREDGSYGSYGKLLDDHRYFYKINAINLVEVISPDSPTASATTRPAPPAVVDLAAESEGLRKVPLAWTSSEDPHVKGYAVYRSESEVGPFVEIATVSGRDKTTYTDTGGGSSWGEAGKLVDARTYYYTVQAINVVDVHSPDSRVAFATTRGLPPTVSGLSATSNLPRKVHLHWQQSTGPYVKGYAIFRGTGDTGPFEEIATVSGVETTEYEDKGNTSTWGDVGSLADDTRYYYKAQAINLVDVRSLDSAVTSATTKALPVAVADLGAADNEVKQVSLNWSPNPETNLDRYEVFRGDTPDAVDKRIEKLPSSAHGYIDEKLDDGRTYYYRVRAVDAYNLEGEFSPVVSATTKPTPQTPQQAGFEFDGERVIVRWQANPEPDIVCYRVLKRAFFSWEKVGECTETSFVLPFPIDRGSKETLRIVAVDETGLVSEPAAEIVVAVPK
jgi:fibronectin type 3 domain-containing protein